MIKPVWIKHCGVMAALNGAAFALSLGLCLFAPLPAHAENANVSVLSADDVALYRDIFDAQSAAKISKADGLIGKLTDKSLLGYVKLQRYLDTKSYKTNYSELKNWLDDYADLPGADRIYKLAVKRAPKKSSVPRPTAVHWRGGGYDNFASTDTVYASGQARSTAAKLRKLINKDQTDTAYAQVKKLTPSGKLPQSDIDKLTAYVAAAYLAEGRNDEAYQVADRLAENGRGNAPNCDWVAGLAAYRMEHFSDAANHFQLLTQSTTNARSYAGAAFWAARAWMRAGEPQNVIGLYNRAASERTTFYGALASRLLGRDIGYQMSEPQLDAASFSELMKNNAARRAVALWQIGGKAHDEDISDELLRAFGEIAPELDPFYAALARTLGQPALELKAAETSTKQNIYLTGLYPIPPYEPQSGYEVDKSLVLAITRQESRFNTDAVSKSGARGLMQIMPSTAAVITHDSSLKGKAKTKLDNPTFNMELGQRYMQNLLTSQNGNLVGLAAAYNAGPGNLSRWLASFGSDTDPLLFIESIPISETRDYVKRVITNLWMYNKRMGQEATGLDNAAAGAWPTYTLAPTAIPSASDAGMAGLAPTPSR